MTVSEGITMTVNANTWSRGTACERYRTSRVGTAMDSAGLVACPSISTRPRAVVAFPTPARRRGARDLLGGEREPGAGGERAVGRGVERRARAGRREAGEIPQRGCHALGPVDVRPGRHLRLAAIRTAQRADEIAGTARDGDDDRCAAHDPNLVGIEEPIDPEVVGDQVRELTKSAAAAG